MAPAPPILPTRSRTRGAADLAARTIPLRADWDIQPRLGSGRGHHVPRAGVDDALADFIERRAEGAMLVVGHRGSGKTSSVVAAANRAAKRERRGRTAVPILIKATSMDNTGTEGHKALLQSLIWALHRWAEETKTVDKGLRRRTRALYLDATASIKSDEVSQSETRSLALGVHTAAAAAAVGLALAALSHQGAIELGLAFVPVVFVPLAAKMALGRKASKTTTRHYKRIYGFADMQHDFEGLLREYGATHKIVFILDEFDKYDGFAAAIQPLKVLFNQGGAAYVVITSPEKAQELMKKRDANYTLFSEVLYINRPLFKEMEKFIDDILEPGDKKAAPSPEYDDFGCCMLYKSKTDFFDLYRALRDRRAGADAEGRPLITVSLDEQETTEANLQRSIEYVHMRKAYGAQSMQMINDDMLDAMYDAAARAESLHGKAITAGDKLAFADGDPAGYPPHAASAVRDLLSLLYKQGYLKREAEGSYLVVGRLAKFDPAGIFVEEENAFVDAYDAVLGALANFANVQSKMVDGHGEPFGYNLLDSRLDDMIRVAGQIVPIDIPEEARAYRVQLRRPSRSLIDPDKLRSQTDAAKAALDTLRTHTADLLSHALEHNGFPTSLRRQIPSELTALAFAHAQSIRNAVHQWHDDDDNDDNNGGKKVTVAVLAVQDATFISKMCSEATSKPRHLREIYIALVGDVEPAGLRDGTIPVGSLRGAEDGGTGATALDMARNNSTYILAVASPPDAKTTEAVISAVKLVVARLTSNRKKGFEKFWHALLRDVGATGSSSRNSSNGSPSPRHPGQAGGEGTGRQRRAATASRPADGPQGGVPQ